MEKWKAIIGYEGLYEVSNLGRVRSLKRNTTNGKILKLNPDKDGYLRFAVCKENTQKMMRVHREVAKAFIENPNNYNIINHKDENKANNNVNNLEWCTAQYNSTYNNINYKRGLKRRKAIVAVKGNEVLYFDSVTIAANALGVSQKNISTIINNGKGRKTLKGYSFYLKEAWGKK